MRRYWVESDSIQGELVTFTDDLFHHIFQVCRQEVGHHFEILNGRNQAFLVEVIEVGKKKATAKILESRAIKPLPKPEIHIALSICRYPVYEAILEKMVEMGVHSIHPFYSDFSFIRSGTPVPDSKWERWQKIIISATQQSGRGELMQMHDPVSMHELRSQVGDHPCIVAYEGETPLSLSERFSSIATSPDQIWIFIGSEGGFSENEVSQFSKWGWPPITLGEQVLRVETACVSLVAIVRHHFKASF